MRRRNFLLRDGQGDLGGSKAEELNKKAKLCKQLELQLDTSEKEKPKIKNRGCQTQKRFGHEKKKGNRYLTASYKNSWSRTATRNNFSWF